MQETTITIADAAAMEQLGGKLAKLCQPGMTYFLYGELGSGKTTLVRGFLRGYGYQGIVKSPTFTLVEPYKVNDQTIYHFDLYRLVNRDELANIGIRDYFDKNAISLIEWPERGSHSLPKPDLHCYFEIDQNHRNVRICATSATGEQLLTQLSAD